MGLPGPKSTGGERNLHGGNRPSGPPWADWLGPAIYVCAARIAKKM